MAQYAQQTAVRRFVETWKGRGYEKGETQSFWYQLLHDIFGIEVPANFIQFEHPVHLKNTKFIDAYIPSTKVIIEQKELKKDLDTAGKQSDGDRLTPYEQAQRYIGGLNYTMWPRWIVTCNFKSFKVYDTNQPQAEPMEILLENLEREYYLLKFLVDDNTTSLRREKEISIKAGELIGKLYNELHHQYHDPDTPQALHSLNVLCIRLVFCLFAEKSLLFGDNRSAFHDYLKAYKPSQMRKAVQDLFDVLDTEEHERDPYIEESLGKFPYVNGGLFNKEDKLEIPQFTESIANLLLIECSEGFDWSGISPTIFGALFEDTMNPETREIGGMHYTSVESFLGAVSPNCQDSFKIEINTNNAERMKKEIVQFKNILTSYNHLMVTNINELEWFIEKSEAKLCANMHVYRRSSDCGMSYLLKPIRGEYEIACDLKPFIPSTLSAVNVASKIVDSLNNLFFEHLSAKIETGDFLAIAERLLDLYLTPEDVVAYTRSLSTCKITEVPSMLDGVGTTFVHLLGDFYLMFQRKFRYQMEGRNASLCNYIGRSLDMLYQGI